VFILPHLKITSIADMPAGCHADLLTLGNIPSI